MLLENLIPTIARELPEDLFTRGEGQNRRQCEQPRSEINLRFRHHEETKDKQRSEREIAKMDKSLNHAVTLRFAQQHEIQKPCEDDCQPRAHKHHRAHSERRKIRKPDVDESERDDEANTDFVNCSRHSYLPEARLLLFAPPAFLFPL